MNYEQLTYLRTLLHYPSPTVLEEFDRAVNLRSMIKVFEAEVHAAWQKFVHDKVMSSSSTVGLG